MTVGPQSEVVCVTLRAPSREIAERLMAEAWESGALGIEERDGGQGVELDLYVGLGEELDLRTALEPFIEDGAVWAHRVVVATANWSEAWKAGLEAIEISPRLAVAPSFVDYEGAPGQRVLWIDPGQAFGTGGHASTRLVLEWIDRLAASEDSVNQGIEVLDVGTGSGVLALAALALGARRAIGLDLDAVAIVEAQAVAGQNGLRQGFETFIGGIEAVAGQRFDWVFANLLKSEMLPILDRLSEAVAPSGWLVLAGLLEGDEHQVSERLARRDLRKEGVRRETDDSGAVWIAPAFRRGA
ncbi:50S ribosomal protein L11 methyltransferase [Myxococcota bacterium]|nr:50S ribosomal protein L11 methyltransferase [Myxococcota bacterium]